MYLDLTTWKDVKSIFYNSGFNGSTTLDSDNNGNNGFNFWWKIENKSTYTQTFACPLSAKGSIIELNPVNGNLIFNKVIYNDNNVDYEVYGDNGKMVTFNNYLVGDSNVQMNIKQNSIVLINYNDANSFRGGIYVEKGELWIGSGAALNGGNISIGNGSTNIAKIYISDPTTSTTITNDIIIPSNSMNSFIGGLNTTNTHIYSGTINLNNNTVYFDEVNTGIFEVSGIISGTGGINKIGNGQIQLSATNTYSGNTTITAGILQIGNGGTLGSIIGDIINNSALVINRSDNYTFSGIISGTGNFTKKGSGILILSGNNTYAGNTVVEGGTLEITGSIDCATLTVNNGATLIVNGNSVKMNALVVDSGGTVIVKSGHTLEVTNGIDNAGVIEIENEGSLLQTHTGIDTNSNSGTYKIMKTTTPYAEYDYTYWSSPTDGETIGNVFNTNSSVTAATDSNGDNNSPADHIYKLETANFEDSSPADGFDDDGNDWVNVDANTVMEKGKGYIAMGAGSDFPFDSANRATGLEQSVFFNGTVNNGDITCNVVTDANSGDSWENQNLIGNPYPSAIDITKLSSQVYDATNNPSGILEGTFYFWTHDTAINSGNPGPDAYNFTNDDYSIVTVDNAGVFSPNASSNSNSNSDYNGIIASKFIASGQGFLANVKSAGTVTFTNAMRVTGENNHFLRQANNREAVSIDRLWLNLTKEDQGIFRQVLVGFYDSATDTYQNGQDGQRLENGSNTDFYSVITDDTRRFAIQNLATFNDTKTIPLGIEIVEAGTYEINIDHSEGVFTQGQKVYLEDTELGVIHNFDNGAYMFTSDVVDNDVRFVLRFSDEALSVDNETLNNLVIYPNPSSGIFTVFVPSGEAMTIEVYDSIGKVVVHQFTDSQIDLSGFAKGIYFAKIQVQDQQIVKKLVVK